MAADRPFPLLRLPSHAREDLVDLARHHEHLIKVARESANQAPKASIQALSSAVAAKADIGVATAQVVCVGLWNLKKLQNELGVDGKTFTEILTSSLEQSTPQRWQAENLELWKLGAHTVAEALDLIGDDHALLISAKAGTLAYTHPNLLVNVKMITDVRPVFDTAASRIVETVVSHTLVIHYADGTSENKMMTFALDQADIGAIKRECERAEQKSKIAVDSLKSLNPVVLGDGN